MLGGRAAEEIINEGVVSTGAAKDLGRASELTRQAPPRFGMSEQSGRFTYGRRGAALSPVAVRRRRSVNSFDLTNYFPFL